MRGNEFLDKMALVDPTYIEAADAPAVKRSALAKKIGMIAACFVLIISIGLGTYAYTVDAKEYSAAVQFFDEYDLPTDGLSRGEIKSVYKDINTKNFSYSKTADVIANSLTPNMMAKYEELSANPTPEELEDFWNYRISVTLETPKETPIEIPPETPAETPAETPLETPAETPKETEDDKPPRRCPGMHKYEERIINEGSCTEDKTIGNVCVNCGWSYVTSRLGKVHTFGEYTVTIPKTCESDGLEVSECIGCGLKDERVIPASHEGNVDEYHIVEESTCKKPGVIFFNCLVCGEYVLEELPLVDHDWIITENAPTCEIRGEKAGTCSMCGIGKIFETYSILGHDDVLVTNGLWFCTRCYRYRTTNPIHFMLDAAFYDATCDTEGLISDYCVHCDLTFEYVIPAKGHKYSETEYVEPTCTDEGWRVSTCTRCGYMDLVDFPKTAHRFERIDDENYKCAECGSKISVSEYDALMNNIITAE